MTKAQLARLAMLMDGLKACEEIADMIRQKIRDTIMGAAGK